MIQDLRMKHFKKLFFISIPFLYLFILMFQQEKAFTQDLGRHLKTGEIIVHTLSIPKSNLFSYVEPNHPFINHHWLSEVLFYISAAVLGLNSLIVIKVFAITISFALVWWFSYKKSGPYWTFLFAIPYLSLFSYRFDARPEVFSFVFMSFFLIGIEKYRHTKKLFYLYPLPFIELLWVNMHIYFIVGILFYSLFIISEVISDRKNVNRKMLSLFSLLCIATLCNPSGLIGALQPTTILQHYGYSIVENQNIFFLNSILPSSSIGMFELLAVVGGAVLIYSRKKDWYVILLFSATAILGASMVRNFPIFVLATFPYLPAVAADIEKKLDIHTRKIVTVGVLVCVGSFLTIDSVSHMQSPIRGFSYYGGAADAADFYQKNHLAGPVFNNFDIGSYLIYRLYPKEHVYVDGRPEAYSVAFFDEYKKMQEEPLEFVRQDARYHFNTIVFSHTDLTPWAQTFLASIIKNKDWVPVYLDPMMVIFVRNAPQNKAVIVAHTIKL